MHKTNAQWESGAIPSPELIARVGTLLGGLAKAGVHKNSRDGVSVYDGPFIETKELIAGYVVVSAASFEHPGRWAASYLDAVEADEADLRELE